MERERGGQSRERKKRRRINILKKRPMNFVIQGNTGCFLFQCHNSLKSTMQVEKI